MVETLSDRDLAIVASVADHRFLTTQHLEALHFTGHASALSAVRSARRVLRRLADLRLLRHLERRVGGVRAGSAGFVWALGPLGDRLEAQQRADAGRPRRRLHEPSLRLLNHVLAIADVHVALVQAARAGHLQLFSVELEPNCWRRFHGYGGEAHLLRPDLAAVTGDLDGTYEDHWFLEVDLGTEHPPTVVRKCQQYLDYAGSGREQAVVGVFPRVVWIVRTPDRGHRLAEAFKAARLDRNLFRVTAREGLVAAIAGGAQ